MLHNQKENLHKSQVFKIFISLAFQLFVKGRRKTRNFFELVRKMRNTAVMQLVGNLGKGEFVV